MKNRVDFPPVNLRVKFALSSLVITLGAILALSSAVTVAVQNYFANAQQDQVRSDAELQAQQIGQIYHSRGGRWDNVQLLPNLSPNLFELVVDTNGNTRNLPPLPFAAPNGFLHPPPPLPELQVGPAPLVVRQSLEKAFGGQAVVGRLPDAPGGRLPSGLFICVPIRDDGKANGQIIGALFLATPEHYPKGSPPYDFLANVDRTILITGLAITLVVSICSLLLARRFTTPLEVLTVAAEQMKGGNYRQRVAPSGSQDELGRLASTFNAMADTIESDVTELRRQEQLRRDLTANMAHDLVTPLTAIQGFSEALADEVIADPKARHEAAQRIIREVQRLRRLVSDIQHMSSLESGRVHLDLAALDLSALVQETLAVISLEYEQASLTVQNEIAPTTPGVLADSDRITQVLLNVLDNARCHTPPGGVISIGAKPEGKFLTVWVRDTGGGITPEDLPSIFERFYRADRARTGSKGGSGLGLSIVKAIISAHGGTIRAESTPGQGTCILFTLPLV